MARWSGRAGPGGPGGRTQGDAGPAQGVAVRGGAWRRGEGAERGGEGCRPVRVGNSSLCLHRCTDNHLLRAEKLPEMSAKHRRRLAMRRPSHFVCRAFFFARHGFVRVFTILSKAPAERCARPAPLRTPGCAAARRGSAGRNRDGAQQGGARRRGALAFSRRPP